jgi:hypothetical protein
MSIKVFASITTLLLTVRSFFDQFQTLPCNSLIFGTLIQPDGNSTGHRWIQGAEQAKSRWTVNFQKLCDFQYLPDVENRRKNERTVSYYFVFCHSTCTSAIVLRYRIERLINRCKQFRHLATRYEKRAANYQAIWLIAAILLWIDFANTA